MNLTAVILAGGRSSRMGRDKAFLPCQGGPLIEHALQVVREAGATEVLISGRPEQDFSAYDCPVLLDRVPDCGPLGGIERGLSAARHRMVLVLAVDMPHMTGDCLRWLISSAMGRVAFHRVADSPNQNGDAVKRVPSSLPMGVVPKCDSRLEPLAACYPKGAHEIVTALLHDKCLPAQEFASHCIRLGLVVPVNVPEAFASRFRNWNTPEDVER